MGYNRNNANGEPPDYTSRRNYTDAALNDSEKLSLFGRQHGYTYIAWSIREPFDNEPQIQLFSNSSRFGLHLTLEGKGNVIANIKPTDVYGIKLRTEFAYNLHLSRKLNTDKRKAVEIPAKKEGNTLTDDYILRISYGSLKGKTPAEALRGCKVEERSSVLSELIRQYKMLSSNKDKHPENTQLMNAIAYAQRHAKDGTIFETTDEEIAKAQKAANRDLAYTVQLKGGRCDDGDMAGQTPAAILQKNSANKDGLLNQRNYLEQNMAKYPANQIQIDAIDAALDLLEEGMLESERESSSKEIITLWESEFGQAYGGKVGWKAKITWIVGALSPVKISITNYPITKDGSTERADSVAGYNTLTRHLIENEWLAMLSSMDIATQAAVSYYAPRILPDAIALIKEQWNRHKRKR